MQRLVSHCIGIARMPGSSTSKRPNPRRFLTFWVWLACCFPVQAATVLPPSSSNPRYQILDGGYRRTFELAEDELFLASEGRMISISPSTATNGSIVLGASTQFPAGELPTGQPVLYEAGRERSSTTRRILTRKVVAKLQPGANPNIIAAAVDSLAPKAQSYAPGYFIFEAAEPTGAIAMSEAMRKRSDVLEAEPLLGRQVAKKAFVNDPYAFVQWHLRNTGQSGGTPGVDLRLTNVWENYRGSGVVIAVVDDGVQATHPDLSANILTSLGYDYRDGDFNPAPSGNDDYHGTPVAGVVAARGNNSLGVAGVAFEASLASVRLIGGINQTDEQDAAAMLHSNQVVHISNNSWGATDDGLTLDGPGVLMEQAMITATRDGRGGRRTVFLFAAGNGATNFTTHATDNANFDGFVNSIYAICVGAVDDRGSNALYSEPGSCVLISGLSDNSDAGRPLITTTDLTGTQGLNRGTSSLPGDYTDSFDGTSAATPTVAGVAALMLQANPNLGWRDVQEILIRSATKVLPNDSDWVTNSAGLRFNHKVGAGLANAEAAVQLAKTWTNLGAHAHLHLESTNLSQSIPDNNTNGITRTFDFSTVAPMRVEHVTVTLTATHSRRGDLVMRMISPTGTISRLAERRLDSDSNYDAWKFMSVFDWGELSSGTWQIQVSDQRGGGSFGVGGTLRALRIDLYGTLIDTRPSLQAQGFSQGRFQLRLNGTSNQTYDLQSSSNLLDWLTVLRTNLVSGSSVQLFDNQASSNRLRFYRAVQVAP